MWIGFKKVILDNLWLVQILLSPIIAYIVSIAFSFFSRNIKGHINNDFISFLSYQVLLYVSILVVNCSLFNYIDYPHKSESNIYISIILLLIGGGFLPILIFVSNLQIYVILGNKFYLYKKVDCQSFKFRKVDKTYNFLLKNYNKFIRNGCLVGEGQYYDKRLFDFKKNKKASFQKENSYSVKSELWYLDNEKYYNIITVEREHVFHNWFVINNWVYKVLSVLLIVLYFTLFIPSLLFNSNETMLIILLFSINLLTVIIKAIMIGNILRENQRFKWYFVNSFDDMFTNELYVNSFGVQFVKSK